MNGNFTSKPTAGFKPVCEAWYGKTTNKTEIVSPAPVSKG